MAEFGGWDMPLQYAGVLGEHPPCRDRAVGFDVAHLGSVGTPGEGAWARDLLAGVAPDAAATPRFAVRPFVWEGAAGWVAGTGYTGEDGVELHVPAEAAVSCWQALLAAGVQPAGLAARDTLRLEMGFPLHGHELG